MLNKTDSYNNVRRTKYCPNLVVTRMFSESFDSFMSHIEMSHPPHIVHPSYKGLILNNVYQLRTLVAALRSVPSDILTAPTSFLPVRPGGSSET